MAQEPQTIRVLRTLLKAVTTVILFHYQLFLAIFRFVIPPAPKDVSDEVVLITGAGHGMGREMALRFARLGAVVVCVDINAKGNKETLLMIKEEKREAYNFECDVTNRTAVFELAEKVKVAVGDVTILVNNAGIMPCKSFLKQTESDIKKMIDINISGYLWTMQAFLPSMIDNNHGHIVAMSSMAGLMGIRNLVPYCASKYAVRGMMQSLAVELADDPRVNGGIKTTTIYPYIVDTGLCHKPRINFPFLEVVKPGDAADLIVDAVRRNYMEISVPPMLYYMNKFLQSSLPFGALKAVDDFINTGVDPHD